MEGNQSKAEEQKHLDPSGVTTSPSFKRRRANVALKIEEEKYENEYSTCCSRSGKTDARLIRYGSKFSLSVFTLGFACVQIARAGDCDPLVPFYSSLITFVLGTWLKTDTKGSVQLPK